MTILSPILFRTIVLMFCFGCNVSQPIQATHQGMPGYEIVFKIFEGENAVDKVMDAFSRNGLRIAKMEVILLSSDRQEIRICIRNTDSRSVNELELQIRSIMKIEDFSIRRI